MAERLTSTPRGLPVRAIDRVCDIVELLDEAAAGVSLAQVAASTGLPKSSALRYLSALHRRGWVTRDAETGRFRSARTPRFAHVGVVERLVAAARPPMNALRQETGETINLALLDGDRVIRVGVLPGGRPSALTEAVGSRAAMHSTALGKSIATHLSTPHLADMLAVERSLADVRCAPPSFGYLLAEVRRCASVGYAVDDCESHEDGRCVGVPVHDTGFIAALSISAPAHRLSRNETVQAALRLHRVAAAISAQHRLSIAVPHADSHDDEARSGPV